MKNIIIRRRKGLPTHNLAGRSTVFAAQSQDTRLKIVITATLAVLGELGPGLDNRNYSLICLGDPKVQMLFW